MTTYADQSDITLWGVSGWVLFLAILFLAWLAIRLARLAWHHKVRGWVEADRPALGRCEVTTGCVHPGIEVVMSIRSGEVKVRNACVGCAQAGSLKGWWFIVPDAHDDGHGR